MENQESSDELGGNQNKRGETRVVRVMQKRAMEKVYKGCEYVRILCYLNTLEDNFGHMYLKSTGQCRFKTFNGIATECAARIEFENMDGSENQWKNVIHMHNFPHTHPSPISKPEKINDLKKVQQSKSEEKISAILTKASSKIAKEKSRYVKDSETEVRNGHLAQANSSMKSGQLKKRKADEQVKNGENRAPSQLRVMKSREINACYKKLGMEKCKKRSRLVIDCEGHIYGPRGSRFTCKFNYWGKYDRKCCADISVDGDMKKWVGWANIKHCSKGHNHPSPFPFAFTDPTQIQGPQIQGTINEELDQSDEDSTSESEYSPEIRESSKKRSRVNDATQNVDHTNISRTHRRSSRFSAEVSNETSVTNDELESSLTSKSDAFVSLAMSFDQSSVLSRFARSNSTTITIEPQLHSTPVVSNTLPTFNPNFDHFAPSNSNTPVIPNYSVTSDPQPSTQLKSTLGSKRQYLLLPAWTNCVQCKACVLIDPKSSTKDLIETAEKHITQFHGHKIVNKEIINQHLPYILNLREVEQSPVCGSLSLNKGGDFWCAIKSCDLKMLNMRDVTLNDNDMINHAIKKHLATGEIMSNEKLWECFPQTSPQNQSPNKDGNKIPAIKLE